MITNPVVTTSGDGLTLTQKLIPYAIQWGFIIGIVIFFFMFIIGAIKWISSGGDKGKLEEAKTTITNALIGLVVLFSVFIILKLIGVFFDVNLLNLTLPTL